MYFPYLRGRQNELLCLRELLNAGKLSSKVIPIIEPVKFSSTFFSTLTKFIEMNHKVIVIRNPKVGSFSKELNDMRKNIEKESDENKKQKLQKTLDGYKNLWNDPGIQKSYLVDDKVIAEIKKSKFITYLHRTQDEQEAKDFLKAIKKEHPNANHHCTAMIIGNIMRSNDDGEPSQTAGHPMLDVLMHNEMQDILAVVVRYFGGIKLGTGGLVRAYSSSVSEALKVATLTTVTTLQEYQIHFSYDLIGKIDHYFRTQNIEVIEQQYEEDVVYHFLVQEDISKDLMELTNGKIQIQYIQDIETECVI